MFITGEANINNHFIAIDNKKKEEMKYVKSMLNPSNVILSNIFTPVLLETIKIGNAKFQIGIYNNNMATPNKDFAVQITEVKTCKSFILGFNYRGDENLNWNGDYIELAQGEKELVTLILNASEGVGPFYFMDELCKTMAYKKKFANFFIVIN